MFLILFSLLLPTPLFLSFLYEPSLQRIAKAQSESTLSIKYASIALFFCQVSSYLIWVTRKWIEQWWRPTSGLNYCVCTVHDVIIIGFKGCSLMGYIFKATQPDCLLWSSLPANATSWIIPHLFSQICHWGLQLLSQMDGFLGLQSIYSIYISWSTSGVITRTYIMAVPFSLGTFMLCSVFARSKVSQHCKHSSLLRHPVARLEHLQSVGFWCIWFRLKIDDDG